jgi:carbon storage regulator
MLVLSRKIKESIVIASNIEVRITKIEGDTVRLGIIAPPEIPIYRKEVLEMIENNNKKAILDPQSIPVQLKSAQKWLQDQNDDKD